MLCDSLSGNPQGYINCGVRVLYGLYLHHDLRLGELTMHLFCVNYPLHMTYIEQYTSILVPAVRETENTCHTNGQIEHAARS